MNGVIFTSELVGCVKRSETHRRRDRRDGEPGVGNMTSQNVVRCALLHAPYGSTS